MALWSGNVGKYEFLTDKDVLQEKDLLEKAATKKYIWIFTIRRWVEKTNWGCQKTVSKIRQGLWIW